MSGVALAKGYFMLASFIERHLIFLVFYFLQDQSSRASNTYNSLTKTAFIFTDSFCRENCGVKILNVCVKCECCAKMFTLFLCAKIRRFLRISSSRHWKVEMSKGIKLALSLPNQSIGVRNQSELDPCFQIFKAQVCVVDWGVLSIPNCRKTSKVKVLCSLWRSTFSLTVKNA